MQVVYTFKSTSSSIINISKAFVLNMQSLQWAIEVHGSPKSVYIYNQEGGILIKEELIKIYVYDFVVILDLHCVYHL